MKLFAAIAFAVMLIAPVAHADEKADVQKLADGWTADYNKHDADAMAKRYTEDGTFSNAIGQTATGSAALKELFAKEWAAGVKVESITVNDTHRVGDVAYASGTFKVQAPGPDGKIGSVNGNWLTVNKCKGDECPIYHHVANMVQPPPK